MSRSICAPPTRPTVVLLSQLTTCTTISRDAVLQVKHDSRLHGISVNTVLFQAYNRRPSCTSTLSFNQGDLTLASMKPIPNPLSQLLPSSHHLSKCLSTFPSRARVFMPTLSKKPTYPYRSSYVNFSYGSKPPLCALIPGPLYLDTNAGLPLPTMFRVSKMIKKDTRFRVVVTYHVSVLSPHASVLYPVNARALFKSPLKLVSSLQTKQRIIS